MGICYGDLNGEKIVGTFYEKNAKTKSERENMINYKLNGKATIILLTDGLIKRAYDKRISVFLNLQPFS